MQRTLYTTQVRTKMDHEDTTDGLKDFLHNCENIHIRGFATNEEAQDALEGAVRLHVTVLDDFIDPEGPTTFTILNVYPTEQGGGFWFETNKNDEGRALVRKIIVE